MEDTSSFAERIRVRYPEGLTGLFAIGGTRTTYILEHNRHQEDPGKIANFQHYSDYLLQRYFDFARMYFELGGHNAVITALGYTRFYAHGSQYAVSVAKSTLALIGPQALDHYRALDADPYFIGIEPLFLLPHDDPGYELAQRLQEFQAGWQYAPGRRKVVWEISSIPLYSFWKAREVLGSEESARLDGELTATQSLKAVDDLTYAYFSQAAYGVAMPVPHFYLGTNRNGDLKMRSVLPGTFIGNSACRMYFTPYPSLMMPREALQAVLEDLAFGDPKLRSRQMDYRSKYTSELAEAEYQRFLALSADPGSILGYSRQVGPDTDE